MSPHVIKHACTPVDPHKFFFCGLAHQVNVQLRHDLLCLCKHVKEQIEAGAGKLVRGSPGVLPYRSVFSFSLPVAQSLDREH